MHACHVRTGRCQLRQTREREGQAGSELDRSNGGHVASRQRQQHKAVYVVLMEDGC